MKKTTFARIPAVAAAALLGAAAALFSPVPAGAGEEVQPPPAPVQAGTETGAAAPFFTGYLSVAWDSAFICEGRNFVEEGGLVSSYLQVDSAWGVSLWLWAADSYETAFAEVDIGLMYSRMLGDLELGGGWSTGHDYQYDDNFTEFYTWTYYRRVPWLVPGARWKYGDFAGGTYLELSLASEYGSLGDRLVFRPSAILGIDFGYATEAVDDYNNVQLMLAASYALTERLSLNGYVAHSIGLEDMAASGHDDETWGGVSLGISF
jgi:hypothetical protein